MDPNLNSLEREDLLKLIKELFKRIAVLEKEYLKLQKRVQVLEP